MTYGPKDALTRASCEDKVLSEDIRREMRQVRTFTVDPKERSCCLPLLKDASLEEPGCGSLVVGTARNVMVGGWVWWGEPSVKALP